MSAPGGRGWPRQLAWMLALASVGAGCTKGRKPYDATADAAVNVAKAPATAPPSAPATRADGMPAPPPGTPEAPEDLRRLSAAAAAGHPDKQAGAPPVERLDAHRVRVGRVMVDRQRHLVHLPGRVNMEEGILEYYACGTNGKLHESVLELFAEPSHIHLGLLLAGHDAAVWDRSDTTQSPSLVTPGAALDLWVVWKRPADDMVQVTRAEDWLYDRNTKASAPPLDWFFHGSVFWSGRYSADTDRSIFALIPDDAAVVMVGGDKGNPYRGERQGFEVFKDVIPPKGTPITLVVVPHGAPPPASEGLVPLHSPTVPGKNIPSGMNGPIPLPQEFAADTAPGGPSAAPATLAPDAPMNVNARPAFGTTPASKP